MSQQRAQEWANNIKGLVVLVLIIVVGFALCTGSGSEVQFSGRVTDFTPIDEANLVVVLRLTNEGDEAAVGECTVTAHDSSGQVGFDILSSPEDLDPAESETYNSSLRIEDEGAFRVVDVEASDCGEG